MSGKNKGGREIRKPKQAKVKGAAAETGVLKQEPVKKQK